MRNIRAFVEALRARGDLAEIEVEVDPNLELAEIHRRVIEDNGKALLFKRVKGSPFPVVTNLFGNMSRLDLAFGEHPEQFVKKVAKLAHDLMPPTLSKLWDARWLAKEMLHIGSRTKSTGAVLNNRLPLEKEKGLDLIPALVQWPEDGGRFVTLPLVYTEHPVTKQSNLGMYRIQFFDEKTTGMHIQIERGGGFHYSVAESRNEALPVTLFIGGPPALILSAIAPLPENISELMLASVLLGEKLERVKLPHLPHALISECEFAIVGKVPPHKRRLEGPFGDHYGYYSLAHEYPFLEVEHIFHRDDAIYPATVVGKPRQEDFYIGEYLQRLLSPLFPLVMPSVKELRSVGETGFHGLALARVNDRYPREALKSAFRIYGEGQLSLQKFLMITDGDVDFGDFRAVLTHFLQRTQWERDFFVISQLSMDTLDYTGPKVNEGSKGIWLALGPSIRELKANIDSSLPNNVTDATVYVPGCLVVQCPRYSEAPKLKEDWASHGGFQGFEIVIMVDDLREATQSVEKFLWTWFTRFEPAADVVGARQELKRFHVVLGAPVFFDCRMKPWYPGTVESNKVTKDLVDKRWKEYFSGS